MVNFMKPISNAVYPNYFSVPDASTNSLLVSTGSEYSATASPNLVFDGTTLAVWDNPRVMLVEVISFHSFLILIHPKS